jgi:hypothetical protein
LGIESELQQQLKAALKKIPELPRTQQSGTLSLLPASADADGHDVIANSYRPEAEIHNSENVGLEPVWPYAIIGDTSPLFTLAQRTYKFRPYQEVADWSFDPIQAARLHLGGEVAVSLRKITETSQHFINGFAHLGATDKDGEFYVEQTGVVAAALPESLVQDYDGTLRIAPAIPPGWSFDGSVFVRGGTKVDVQVRNGEVTTIGLELRRTQKITVRRPWPGTNFQAVEAKSHHVVATLEDRGPESALTFLALAGHSYLIERVDQPTLSFAAIDGQPATSYRKLGGVQIGLPPR